MIRRRRPPIAGSAGSSVAAAGRGSWRRALGLPFAAPGSAARGRRGCRSSQREHQQRQRGAVEADAAGLHDRELAGAASRPKVTSTLSSAAIGNHVVDELRRHVAEQLPDHRGRRLALEHLVGLVDEGGDVEEAEQRQERKAGDAQVEPADVAVEEVRRRRATGGAG